MPQLHETLYGKRFFESQLPDLIKAINKLNGQLPAIADLLPKTTEQPKGKEFPNGFESWMETHYEIAAGIEKRKELPGTESHKTVNSHGICGAYRLSESLTDQFEQDNKGREWIGEFFVAIEEFLNKNA
jgi:hypothetical protein